MAWHLPSDPHEGVPPPSPRLAQASFSAVYILRSPAYKNLTTSAITTSAGDHNQNPDGAYAWTSMPEAQSIGWSRPVPETEFLSRLFETGSFSDLRIICGDVMYSLHKAIVCTQCKFFANACDGRFAVCVLYLCTMCNI